MLLPGEVLAESDTQVLATVYYLQCMAMNMVVGLQDLFLVVADSDDCAFASVKFYLLGFFPSYLPGGGLGLDLM